MMEGSLGGNPAPRCAAKEADLHQEGFIHVLDGVRFLAYSNGKRRKPNGAPGEPIDHRVEDRAINFIQAKRIHAEYFEGATCDLAINRAVRSYLSEVANASQ